MKPDLKIIGRGLITAALLLLSAACAPSPQQVASQTTAAAATLAAGWTSTPSPTTTLTPTLTSTATVTPTPTRTPIPLPQISWQTGNVDDTYKTGPYSALAVDTDGTAHVAYINDGTDDLNYAVRASDGGKWVITRFETPNVDGLFPNIALDASGTVHILRYILGARWIAYMKSAPTGWDITAFINNANPAGVSLAVDHAKKPLPQVVYFEKKDATLKYARFRPSGWRSQDIATTVEQGFTFPLVLDDNDQPHVAFYDSANGLQYATKPVEALDSKEPWHMETADDSGVFAYPSLALDPAHEPHMAYYDSERKVLKHAWRADGKWQSEVVDAEGDVGLTCAIKIDALGHIHIAYFDAANRSLKYAVGKSGQWQTAVVDKGGEGGAGKYPSLALDGDGHPHITYYDLENRILKIADGDLK